MQNSINSLNTGKANSSHSHDDRYFTETEVNTKLNGKSNTDHSHDGRYYTESEINTKITTLQNYINSLVTKLEWKDAGLELNYDVVSTLYAYSICL